MSTADGLYPAAGWHIRGRDGRLLDAADQAARRRVVRPRRQLARRATRQGARASPPARATPGSTTTAGGVQVRRVPTSSPDGDARHAGRPDAHLVHGADRTPGRGRALGADAVLPVGLDHAGPAGDFNLRTPAPSTTARCVFREQGTPPVPNAAAHDCAALVAADRTPAAHAARRRTTAARRTRAVVCPATGTDADTCDDAAFGKGTGGQLTYDVKLPAGQGDDAVVRGRGLRPGRQARRVASCGTALRDPAEAARPQRSPPAGRSPRTPWWTCPATGCWSRASSGASRTSPTPCRRRTTCSCGPSRRASEYPAPSARSTKARWIGAGWPDYPWLFGTDGEYTAFAGRRDGPVRRHQGPPARAARRQRHRQRATAARSCTR